MTDLETVLPTGVQVLSIEPEVSADGKVAIRLRVSGARDRAVDLVRNLEKSRHFAYPRLAGEALATQTGGPNQGAQPINASIQVNFDILADYRPLSDAEEKAAKASEGKPDEAKPDRGAEDKAPGEKSGGSKSEEKKPQTRRPAPFNAPNTRPGGAATPVRRGEQ